MISGIRIFDRLNIEFPEKEIFLRLGGNCFKTVLDENARIRLMQSSRSAFELCVPRGRFAVLKIDDLTTGGADTPDGFLALGQKFCAMSKNAAYLWCGAVTVGEPIIRRRDGFDRISDSAVADAVGSECADAAMDVLFSIARAELLRQGMVLDEHRYSPGYGDMPLSLQTFFYQKLNMAEMGITLTGNCFLLPEKSVTAFAFIHNLQENQQ